MKYLYSLLFAVVKTIVIFCVSLVLVMSWSQQKFPPSLKEAQNQMSVLKKIMSLNQSPTVTSDTDKNHELMRLLTDRRKLFEELKLAEAPSTLKQTLDVPKIERPNRSISQLYLELNLYRHRLDLAEKKLLTLESELKFLKGSIKK